jgi:hypothetical protein
MTVNFLFRFEFSVKILLLKFNCFSRLFDLFVMHFHTCWQFSTMTPLSCFTAIVELVSTIYQIKGQILGLYVFDFAMPVSSIYSIVYYCYRAFPRVCSFLYLISLVNLYVSGRILSRLKHCVSLHEGILLKFLVKFTCYKIC